MKKSLLLVMTAVLFIGTAFAQDNAPAENDESAILINPAGETAAGEAQPVDGGRQALTVPKLGIMDFLKMIFFLGLVILIIYLFFYFLKKISGRNLQNIDKINILGSKIIKGDAAMHLVEVGNHVFLVGSGSSSVQLISEIKDKETLDDIRLNLNREQPSGPGNFLSFLTGKGKMHVREKDLKTTTEEGVLFLKKQRDKLNRL